MPNGLSQRTGQQYRLLSEAEWEYVARAGTRTARYWGASEEGQCRYANGANGFAPCPDGFDVTAPVGSFEPNAFGLYDMLGNVQEWVDDCWNGSHEGAPMDGSVRQEGDCSRRVLRGGSWLFLLGPDSLRSASRNSFSPRGRNEWIGFRVARTMD